MKVIFIADAHLKKRKTQDYTTLMAFLDSLRGRNNGNGRKATAEDGMPRNRAVIRDVDDLYILGDFFDFWFCEGAMVYPEFREIIEKLKDVQEQGIRIHLCEGNHDFFLSDFFTGHLAFEVIKDWATIDLDGQRVLISHGDMVDENNIRYLMLRRFLRSRFLYRLQRACPVELRWKVGQIMSYLSKELTVETSEVLAEKMRRFSLRKFRDGFSAVILGHCHVHTIDEQVINGSKKTFAILGDWVRHNSYLCYEDGAFSLSRFRPH